MCDWPQPAAGTATVFARVEEGTCVAFQEPISYNRRCANLLVDSSSVTRSSGPGRRGGRHVVPCCNFYLALWRGWLLSFSLAAGCSPDRRRRGRGRQRGPGRVAFAAHDLFAHVDPSKPHPNMRIRLGFDLIFRSFEDDERCGPQGFAPHPPTSSRSGSSWYRGPKPNCNRKRHSSSQASGGREGRSRRRQGVQGGQGLPCADGEWGRARRFGICRWGRQALGRARKGTRVATRDSV